MNSDNQFLLYPAPNVAVTMSVFLKDEAVWLTQKVLAELFGVDRTVITRHLRNIFKGCKLTNDSACANFAHAAEDGKTYRTNFYNLETKLRAKGKYAVYRQRQDVDCMSDFDREIKRIEGKKP